MSCGLAQDPRYLRFSVIEKGAATHYNLRVRLTLFVYGEDDRLLTCFCGAQVSNAKIAEELLEEIIHPGALECRARIAEELNEMKDQLRKQLNRVRELRVRKAEEPGELITYISLVYRR